MKSHLLHETGGAAELVLGNEAIVRGALEAGLAFACGYPGTPASEIIDELAAIGPARGIEFEYSVNEKIALEMAFAASLAGARSLVAMKHLGLTYAGDPLTTIPYVGTVGGMVIVSAADPSCRTSPNEQDQRYLGPMLHLPTLDPSTPQEALEMTRFAFELSEKSRLPVLLRPTTRLCHTRCHVVAGALREPVKGQFVRDPSRFVPVPKNAVRLRAEIPERLATAGRLLASQSFAVKSGTGKRAVLATGVPAATAQDELERLGAVGQVTFLRLGVVHPLPERWLVSSLTGVDTVLVIEELSPFVEDALRALVQLHGLEIEILGKRTGHIPVPFELEPDVIRAGLHRAFGFGQEPASQLTTDLEVVPPRPPVLCASCGHRSAFMVARSVFGEETLFFNDIGCYTLGAAEPLKGADALLCMGAGFSLAQGVSRMTGRRTVGFLGDSTFYHSGMPALLNAIKENANMVAVILDNQVTAMTGFQDSPLVQIDGGTGAISRQVEIEPVVRALGAKHVETVNPNQLAATTEAFVRARDATGISVIIAKEPCAVLKARVEAPLPKRRDRPSTYVIDQGRCRKCGRHAEGHRCKVPATVGFMRSMARARSLEVRPSVVEQTEVAPCAAACPLHLCIQGYASSIAAGEFADALAHVMETLPLPDSVCRVCDRPCEAVCYRKEVDEPIAINDLKRFVVDWANRQDEFPYQVPLEADSGKRVAIVGAGPAGLSAAQELRRRGHSVTLYDQNSEPGGLLLTGIPRYRLPIDALRRDVARILDLGVDFQGGRRLGDDLDLDQLVSEFDAVFVAVGAPRPFQLEIPGWATAPMIDALSYLHATRDQVQAGDRRVVVVGGGNSAIDAARTALRAGAEKVTVACLEARSEMPAIANEIAEAEAEGVEILSHTRLVRWSGGALELCGVAPRVPGVFDPDNFAPVPGSEQTIEADRIITAIGQGLDLDRVAGSDSTLPTTGDGLVAVDPDTGATAVPGLFAGGDCTPGRRTVTGAMAAGLRSAWAIDRVLRGVEVADRRMPPPRPSGKPARLFSRPGRVDRRARISARSLPAGDAAATFREVHQAPTELEAIAEAQRCMVCGMCGNCRACLDLFGCPAFRTMNGEILIDPALCTACGVCAQFCPDAAINPEDDR